MTETPYPYSELGIVQGLKHMPVHTELFKEMYVGWYIKW